MKPWSRVDTVTKRLTYWPTYWPIYYLYNPYKIQQKFKLPRRSCSCQNRLKFTLFFDISILIFWLIFDIFWRYFDFWFHHNIQVVQNQTIISQISSSISFILIISTAQHLNFWGPRHHQTCNAIASHTNPHIK